MANARYDYTTQRLFVEHDLHDGLVLEAERSQANYLLNVMRMKAGAPLLLFNGRDGEWLGEICDVRRKACNIRLLSCTRTQPLPYDLVYLFAPLKKGRMDYMVQKAVEMGVGILQPVVTRYTQNSKLNLSRMRANALEAAEQCGILNLPTIREPEKLDRLLSDWDTERQIIYGDEAAQNHDLVEKLGHLRNSRLALLIGPEGGFCEEERAQLRAMKCVVPISLGPRILRADTAAVAALAVLQSVAGDWVAREQENSDN